jgi:hypothetical protein
LVIDNGIPFAKAQQLLFACEVTTGLLVFSAQWLLLHALTIHDRM